MISSCSRPRTTRTPPPGSRRGASGARPLVAALEEGLGEGRLAVLILAAEYVAALDRADARLLAELLADAALAAASAPAEALRHRAVAGRLSRIARRAPAAALRAAALLAADPPADNRKGNRRMHYERVLLELYAAARP